MGILTKEQIIGNQDYQREVFRYYYPQATEGKPFKIRDEKTPSAHLKFIKDVLVLTDFGADGKAKNCLDLVIEKEVCSFPEALRFISNKILSGNSPNQPTALPISPKKPVPPKEIVKKPFTNPELEYFGVSEQTLNKFNVYSLRSYGKLLSRSDYFLFLYDFGEFKKVNRPHDKENRFLWTGPRPKDFIFGWDQLPDNPEMIIVAAGEKDVLNLVDRGFPAISLNSESARLTGEQFSRLKKKSGKLFVCYDLDDAGRKNALALIEEYPEFQNLQLPSDLKQFNDFRGKPCKDVADFFRHYKAHDFRNLIESAWKSKNINEQMAKDETGIHWFTIVKNFLNNNYDLRFNEVSNAYECKLKSEDKYRELNEDEIYVRLREIKIHVSFSDLTAIFRSGFINSYDPFQEYFDSLPDWDPENDPDYFESLADYIKATDRQRFFLHLKKHLVRTEACALERNVFNKQALIMVGVKQNSGKSTFCRWLCPPTLENYFAENISTDKDSRISICENILINLDELSTLAKTEIQALKSLFSKDKEKLRRPYDRRASIIPRRASFIGSTDRAEFLNDEAGTVRWLCIEINGIDFAYKMDININDLWRQVNYLYKTGFKYELTPEEIRENEIVNNRYQIVTFEMELIQTYLIPGTYEDNDTFINAVMFIEIVRSDNKDAMAARLSDVKIGKAFKTLGFTRSQKYFGTHQRHGYYVRFNQGYKHLCDNPGLLSGSGFISPQPANPDLKHEDLPF